MKLDIIWDFLILPYLLKFILHFSSDLTPDFLQNVITLFISTYLVKNIFDFISLSQPLVQIADY